MKLVTVLTDFQKILKYKVSWKYVLWGLSCSMQTDSMMKLIVSFHNFTNTRNKIKINALQKFWLCHRCGCC